MSNRQVTLYIATCVDSGLKYFGKTIKWHTNEDLQKHYWGSGPSWIEHYSEFGNKVNMKVYWTGLESEVEEVALKFSKDNNITSSYEWLNQIVENGLGGGVSGYKHSDATKQQMRDNHYSKKPGYVHPMLGVSPSQETRELWSKQRKGKAQSKQHIENAAKGRTGLKRSDETKAKQSKSAQGRVHKKSYCKFCNEEFNVGTIYRHENCCMKNPNPIKQPIIKYQCQYCDRKIGGKHNLNRHEKSCKGE